MRIAIATLWSALALLTAASRGAEPPAAPKEPATLRFRRVYIPEGATDWPKGNVKYLPMDAAEFDRLLGTVQRTAPVLPAQSAAGLVRADYECRLKGQSVLQGSGTLDVSPAVPSSTFLGLDPCNLAIDRAHWITSDGAPAVLGMSSDGSVQFLAERAGQMKFEWSLAGQTGADEGVSFNISLPRCPLSRLRIELPADLVPTPDRGIIAAELAKPAEPGFRRWCIDLGGCAACRLRFAKPGSEPARRQVVLADQSAIYGLSLRGLDAAFELNIDERREPLRKISLDVDSRLELTGVAAGGVPLPWSPAAAPHGDTPAKQGRRQLVVELPSALQEGALKLDIRAVAPLPADGLWTLPRLFVEGAVCRTNNARLAVSTPLCIAGLTSRGCRQTAVAAIKPAGGEQLDFELCDSDATLELLLSRQPTEIQAVRAATTEIGQGKMISRVAADFRASEGAVFELRANVLPSWTIDSVTSQPADALDDWPMSGRGGERILVIRLAHPMTPSRPLRLIVAAHRLYAGSGRNQDVALKLDDVVPLRFTAPVVPRRLIDLRASGPNELRASGDDRPWRVDVKELTPAELDLCGYMPGDVLLRDEPAAAALRLSLTPRGPAYTAVIRLEAVVAAGTLEESYRILCTPAGAKPIDRLVVHFNGRRDAPLSWVVEGMEETRFAARRWTAAQESAAGLTAEEEAWDLTFGNHPSAPIALRAVRRTKFAGQLPLCLASLPDAATQQASVIVRSFGPQGVRVATRRVAPLPIDAAPPGRIQTVRAACRYDARALFSPNEAGNKSGAPRDEPAVVLAAVDRTEPTGWAWGGEIRSRFTAEGQIEHLITYNVESVGAQRIVVKLPSPLCCGDIRSIAINGALADPMPADPAGDSLPIDLPAGVRFVTFALRIAARGAPLAMFQRLHPPLIDIGVPVLSQRWIAELPPGYMALDGNDTREGAAASYGVRQRLLGFLARSDEQQVFDPFRVRDWRNLALRGDGSDMKGAETAGWSQSRMNASEGASIMVIHRPAVDAAGWLLFLAFVGIGAWPRTGHPAVMIVLAAICGSCALLMPAALANAFSLGLWGVAFCVVLAIVRRGTAAFRERTTTAPPEMPSTLSNALPFAAPLLAAAMVMTCRAGLAATEPSADAPAYSVFIPVNDKQQPTGGKYLVPEAFYSVLYRRAALHADKPQGWMITAAVYRAALADDADPAENVVDRLTADYEIRVFNAPARVRIPLHRDEVSLMPDEARLDDRAAQPEWEPDGSALTMEIAEPGEYRLELALRPKVRTASRSGGFELAIPRVPGARLEVTAARGGPPVTVPSALGGVHWEEIPSRWTAELGPADLLAVNWQDAADAGEPLDVQQLQWLRIETGCVLLNVRLKAKAVAGQVRRLQVKADSSLALLPDAKNAVREISASAGNPTQTLEVQLPPTTLGEAAVDLHFLCSGAASVGTFRAPQIEVVGARPGRRWLAVSIDPSLDRQLPAGASGLPPRSGGPGSPPDSAAVSEFMSNWGRTPAQRVGEKAPDAAFHLNGDAADWSMTTRVRKTETTGDQSTSWSFDTGAVQLHFDARLATVGGSVFQYRLTLPPAFEVDSLAVTRDGVAVPARWIRNQEGLLTVFLAGATTGRQRLQLRGHLPLPLKGRIPMPQIRLDDVHVQNSVVRLYRREQVAIEVFAPAGLAEIRAQADEGGRDDLGQPVRAFYVDPAGTTAISVNIQAQPPQPRAKAPVTYEPPVTPTPGHPLAGHGARIVFADVRFAWPPDRCIGAAGFDVDSPVAANYSLELPPGFELTRLSVDGAPVDVAAVPDGRYHLALPGNSSRSRVEILFCTASAGSSKSANVPSRMAFQAPRLGDLPVENMAWTIAAPLGLQLGRAEADGGVVPPNAADETQSIGLLAQWRQLAECCGQSATYAFNRRVDQISVDFTTAFTPVWHVQLASVAGFLAVVALVAVTLRRGVANWLGHRPHACGIAVGIAWWLWASPSALGLAIVLAVLLHQVTAAARLFRPLAGRPGGYTPRGGGA
jgi:hypothetical protein